MSRELFDPSALPSFPSNGGVLSESARGSSPLCESRCSSRRMEGEIRLKIVEDA
jgi:hypothetical protein